MELYELSKRLGVALLSKGYTISTVEECTCGLLGATIASVEYPERWYKGTMTAYTKEVVNKVLGVPSYIIEKNDFVSSQVAQQMAIESLYKFESDISIGVVGYTDSIDGEAQICVAKMHNDGLKFAFNKVKLDGEKVSDNIEKIIGEAIRTAIELIIE